MIAAVATLRPCRKVSMNAAGSRWDGPCKWKITGKNPSLRHMRENLRSRTVLPAPRRPHTATFPALPP